MSRRCGCGRQPVACGISSGIAVTPQRIDIPPPPWPLIARTDDTRVLAEIAAPPATPFVQPRRYGRDSFPEPSGTIPALHAPPVLQLVEMRDLAMAPRSVLLGTRPAGVLEASFNQRDYPYHRELRPSGEGYAPGVVDMFAGAVRYPDAVYWADVQYPEPFGHLLMEMLPRLWARAAHAPGVPVATSIAPDRTMHVLMGALDVRPDEIVVIDRPMVPDAAFVATQPVFLRDYVHPLARETFARLARLGERSDGPAPERLYLSRSGIGRRRLVDEAAVEAMFAAAGFTIYRPEEHAIEDQIRAFSQARLIAGTAGSAMHGAVFAPKLERILLLSSPAWFTLIDLFLHQQPGRLGIVFGTPVEGERGVDADWSIDLAALRRAMREHLELGGDGND